MIARTDLGRIFLRVAPRILLAVMLLVGPGTAGGAEPPLTKGEIETIIREYLLSHPEVILESVRTAQERQRAEERQRAGAALLARQDELLRDPSSPVGGNPDGDVTVVEFFDYHCGHCQRVALTLAELVAEDRNVRVVYKELPILSPESLLAAQAALAANLQGKYGPFHRALMAADGPLGQAAILAIASQVGLDPARLQVDMRSRAVQEALQKNDALARAIGLRGTPAFVIGSELIPGAPDLAGLKALVARARGR